MVLKMVLDATRGANQNINSITDSIDWMEEKEPSVLSDINVLLKTETVIKENGIFIMSCCLNIGPEGSFRIRMNLRRIRNVNR